ncbi:MAG: TIGR03960 family B12-binding radical SAM protein [Lachnospiraceae bacterium]|nr:TIGR03960 family B12-binding radical SAM protein [Lachnospiraceae bacterium]MBQ2579049.1 TIGR03960 family B12-binding radical SAM protein [Lachnospiraceae bacterium]
MRKLALSDDILMRVDKAARYIGNEFNSVKKDLSQIDIRFAMCFPDVYEIGMSHLGIQILYEMFNRRSDTYCERVYSPWPDLHAIMKEEKIPLFSLETQSPIRDFDFLGITLQYEMCYTNILQVLDLSGIALFQKDRAEEDPIVIGGGPCVYNPEPIADFFDLFYIGEGETVYNQLLDLYKSMKADGSYSRAEFLHEASKIPGIYVPSLYDVTYNEDGTIASFTPVYEDVPKKVKRQVVMDLDDSPYPMKPVVPYVRATQDRVVLEIQRGCIRGCRFCQAGMIYRPNREKSLEVLRDYAIQMLENTGYDEISLSSLSSSDYTQIEDLVNFLIEECNKRKINISLPSLRIDSFSLDVMSKVQDINKSSLTFAPEAGSQRMRNTINKGLTEEDIMNGAELAFQGGWNKVKFYFMLGLPGEEEEDMRAIPELSNRVAALYYDTVPKEKRHGKCQITMSTSFFVPKPWTPFQWARMYEPNEYLRRAKIVNDTMKEQLNHKSLSYQWHQADVTVLEGIFARGDRKLSKAIAYAYEQGCFFDAWGEYFDYQKWLDAFAACGIDPDFYTMREREITEILPWDFIDTGIRREFLEHEWEQAKAKVVTPNCKMRCSGCGCKSFGGGICYEG